MRDMRRRWARRPDGERAPSLSECRRAYNPRPGACLGIADECAGAVRPACRSCANFLAGRGGGE